MRDTKALQAARTAEQDPYARRFGIQTWNRTVTVLDLPRLFYRLPEFESWTKAMHAQAAEMYLTLSMSQRRIYLTMLLEFIETYGENGPLIAGGFREDWPDHAKDACRTFARLVTDSSDKSHAHWCAAGRASTRWSMRRDEAVIASAKVRR